MKNEKKRTIEKSVEAKGTVSVFLPEEGNGRFVEGAINGENFRIRTGAVVEVPERIAAVLIESQTGLVAGEAAVGAYLAAGGKRLM